MSIAQNTFPCTEVLQNAISKADDSMLQCLLGPHPCAEGLTTASRALQASSAVCLAYLGHLACCLVKSVKLQLPRMLCAANTLLAAGKPEDGEATGTITLSDVNSAFEISERSRQLLMKYR